MEKITGDTLLRGWKTTVDNAKEDALFKVELGIDADCESSDYKCYHRVMHQLHEEVEAMQKVFECIVVYSFCTKCMEDFDYDASLTFTTRDKNALRAYIGTLYRLKGLGDVRVLSVKRMSDKKK